MAQHQTVVILDFGGQYNQLIARRVREMNIYCEVLPCHTELGRIRALSPVGIILSGGPASVYDEDAPVCDKGIFEMDIPVLGICYGMHIITKTLLGDVQRADKREFGQATVRVEDTPLFEGVQRETVCWMSHGDQVSYAAASIFFYCVHRYLSCRCICQLLP